LFPLLVVRECVTPSYSLFIYFTIEYLQQYPVMPNIRVVNTKFEIT